MLGRRLCDQSQLDVTVPTPTALEGLCACVCLRECAHVNVGVSAHTCAHRSVSTYSPAAAWCLGSRAGSVAATCRRARGVASVSPLGRCWCDLEGAEPQDGQGWSPGPPPAGAAWTSRAWREAGGGGTSHAGPRPVGTQAGSPSSSGSGKRRQAGLAGTGARNRVTCSRSAAWLVSADGQPAAGQQPAPGRAACRAQVRLRGQSRPTSWHGGLSHLGPQDQPFLPSAPVGPGEAGAARVPTWRLQRVPGFWTDL